MPFALSVFARPALDSLRVLDDARPVRRFSLILTALLTCGLLAAGWYAYDRGFTRKWRTAVASEFRKRGVELRVGKLTLEPFRGIIAKNVTIYDARDQRRVLAVIDEMRLVINWANLMQGKTFLDALDLTKATLSLPIDPEKPRGPKIDITGLRGRLFLPPQQIYLSRLEADLYGVHLTASGRLINPQKFHLATGLQGMDPRPFLAVAGAIVEEMRALKFAGAPAELTLRFSGDFAAPEKIFGEATLWAEQATWRGVPIDNFYLAADYQAGRLEVNQLVASDASGALQLSGQYDPAQGSAALSVHSTLDLAPWVRALVRLPALQEVTLHGAPTIDLSGRIFFDRTPRLRLLGHVSIPTFAYRGVEFQELAMDFSSDGERWSARDLRIVHSTGEINGDILHVPGEVRAQLQSTIEPELLQPVLTGPAGEWLREAGS